MKLVGESGEMKTLNFGNWSTQSIHAKSCKSEYFVQDIIMELELDHRRWKVVISDDGGVGDCEWERTSGV